MYQTLLYICSFTTFINSYATHNLPNKVSELVFSRELSQITKLISENQPPPPMDTHTLSQIRYSSETPKTNTSFHNPNTLAKQTPPRQYKIISMSTQQSSHLPLSLPLPVDPPYASLLMISLGDL